MDPRIGMLLVTLAVTSLALYHLLGRRRSADQGAQAEPSPPGTAVFVKSPDAMTSISGGELILSLPQQGEGLALNAVAARCWELMDGSRSLASIAAVIAAEHQVSAATALAEIGRFALRLRAGYYALHAHEWSVAHTHFSDLFAGARDEGIAESRRGDTMILHAAAEALDGDGRLLPARRRGFAWRLLPGGGRRLRRAQAAFARHLEREAPLRAAMKAFENGWAHSAAGRLHEAETAFQEAARLSRGWAHPHYQLGYVYLRERRYDLAVDQFTSAEQISPGLFMVREYLDLARKLADGRLTFEAFHLFEKAAGAEPGDPDLVISLCRRALELSPDFPSARLVLGRAYARKRDYERALDELRHAINNGPDASTLCNALYARGSIFMARGMAEQAVREFEKVIELNGSAGATRSAMAHLASSASVH